MLNPNSQNLQSDIEFVHSCDQHCIICQEEHPVFNSLLAFHPSRRPASSAGSVQSAYRGSGGHQGHAGP